MPATLPYSRQTEVDPSQSAWKQVIPVGMDDLNNVYIINIDSDGKIASRNYIWNSTLLEWETATGSLTAGNNVTVVNFPATQPVSDIYDDIIAQYRITDLDTAGDPSYYGFTMHGGGWYILQLNLGAGTGRYVSGSTNYTGNWGNRNILGYDYFYAVF
jgi:hypothetical protein